MKIFCSSQYIAWVSLFAALMQAHGAFAEKPIPDEQQRLKAVSQLISNNLKNHPQFNAINAELSIARAVLQGSKKAVFNPELELEFEDSDVETKILGINQTIDWGDQQGSRTAIAQAQLSSAVAEYDVAVQSLMQAQLTHLANNQTQQQLVRLSNETLGLMKEFKQIAERRYHAGDLSQVELNLAQLAFSQALMAQANTQADATEAREQLRAILGYLPTRLPVLPEQLPEPELSGELDVFIQALPVIQKQLADIQVARQQVNLRKSERAWNPTIGLSAGAEGQDNLLGLSLSIPLNVRNSFSAEVDAAKQQFISHEYRAHLSYRNAQALLLTTFERYRGLLGAWNVWREQSRDSVEQQLKLIKKLWLAGDINATDYLMQLKQAHETKASGLKLRNQLWQVAFEWMSMTATIDRWLSISVKDLGKL